MKQVLSGRQSFRNPNLVHVLNKFDYIENYATGLQKILSAYDKYQVKPILEPMDTFFVVTLPNIKTDNNDGFGARDATVNEPISVGNDTVNVGVNVGVKLNATQKAVYELLYKNQELTAEYIAVKLNKSECTIERALAELKEKGYIERVGSDKKGFWKILK